MIRHLLASVRHRLCRLRYRLGLWLIGDPLSDVIAYRALGLVTVKTHRHHTARLSFEQARRLAVKLFILTDPPDEPPRVVVAVTEPTTPKPTLYAHAMNPHRN